MQQTTQDGHSVMNSSGISREDPITAGPADMLSSPSQKAQETQSVGPPSPPCHIDRKPLPLPRWLQLRINASAPLNISRRHGPDHVVVIPFNKVAKLNVRVTEIAAINFVRANISIPVPESKSTKIVTTTFTNAFRSLVHSPYSLLTINADLRSP
jgi:hypothetical protein